MNTQGGGRALSPDPFYKVREQLQRGDLTEATRLYRQVTGAGQEEAREAIAAMHAGLPEVIEAPAADDGQIQGTSRPVRPIIIEPADSNSQSWKSRVRAEFTSQRDGSQRTISGRWAVNCGTGGTLLLCLVCCGLPLLLTYLGVFSRTR
jgi:hypothetical protein